MIMSPASGIVMNFASGSNNHVSIANNMPDMPAIPPPAAPVPSRRPRGRAPDSDESDDDDDDRRGWRHISGLSINMY